MILARINNLSGAFIGSNLKGSFQKSLRQGLNVNYTQKLELGVSGLNMDTIEPWNTLLWGLSINVVCLEL